ncbi:MAG: hypothetical protein ACLP8S_17580 [Solirubrobacteraceae bacterium]
MSFHHPSQELLREGLREVCEPLRQLYPSVEDPFVGSVRMMSTTGMGGSPQLVLLASNLVTMAARWSGWPDRLVADEFFEQLDAVVQTLRQLARRRGAEVPAVAGLAGVVLAPDQLLETDLV